MHCLTFHVWWLEHPRYVYSGHFPMLHRANEARYKWRFRCHCWRASVVPGAVITLISSICASHSLYLSASSFQGKLDIGALTLIWHLLILYAFFGSMTILPCGCLDLLGRMPRQAHHKPLFPWTCDFWPGWCLSVVYASLCLVGFIHRGLLRVGMDSPWDPGECYPWYVPWYWHVLSWIVSHHCLFLDVCASSGGGHIIVSWPACFPCSAYHIV